MPLLVTAHRANDILSTIRLGQEFHLKIVLDGAAKPIWSSPEIKASGVSGHPASHHAPFR